MATVIRLEASSTAPLAPRVKVPDLVREGDALALGSAGFAEQEQALIGDVLNVLLGLEGSAVHQSRSYRSERARHRLQGPRFSVPRTVDPSLRDMCTKVVVTGTHFYAVQEYIAARSQAEYGVVNHALCAALRHLSKEHMTFVAQLEHHHRYTPAFTLHRLYTASREDAEQLSTLYDICQLIVHKELELALEEDENEVEDIEGFLESLKMSDSGFASNKPSKLLKGGAVLEIITSRLRNIAGDSTAKQLLTFLLSEASKPYMKMLNSWIHSGEITDSHAEFLIKEQRSIRKEKLDQDYTDEYWDKRYTIREIDLPSQIEHLSGKILLAGKYLNVVRECGGSFLPNTTPARVSDTIDDLKLSDDIHLAYAFANRSLLEVLLTSHALLARLRSMKHYFFLDRPDFFNHFLDISSYELRKSIRTISTSKLQSLLDLCLRLPGTVAANDPYNEDVTVELNNTSLTEWLMKIVSVSGVAEEALQNGNVWTEEMSSKSDKDSDKDKSITGISALQLDYKVPFPLSLVISRKAVLRYQLLFRHLLSLRHVEMQLSSVWLEHVKTFAWRKKSACARVETWKKRVWFLRARMLNFIRHLIYFSTNEIIEPAWHILNEKVEQSITVDNLMQDHIDFLDTCLKECMLTNPRLLRILSKMISTCTMFATYTPHLARSLQSADPQLSPHSNDANSIIDTTRLAKLDEVLKKYEENFSHHLRVLVDALNYYSVTESVALLGLISRIDTGLYR